MVILSRYYPREVFDGLGRLIGLPTEELEDKIKGLIRPYEIFTIPKGVGAVRTIEAPAEPLKRLQRRILDRLLYRTPVSPDCHGFVPGRSIVTNARVHARQRQAICYDIADAYPSVSRNRIVLTISRRLGSYLKHRGPRLDRDIRGGIIELITDLVSVDDHLPQGAPTSGSVLNLVLFPFDRKMRRFIAQWRTSGYPGIRFSRYADDVTLSAQDELPADAEAILRGEIHRAGFRFNPQKVARADRNKGQMLMICGLHVDGDTLRLPRRTLRRYRSILHKSFFSDTLSPKERSLLYGIAGIVQMVYGQWPPQLSRTWRLLASRHDLCEPMFSTAGPTWTGYE